MLERLVAVRLGQFMERSGVLPTIQFAYQKVWVPVMHFFDCHIHCNMHWRMGRRLGLCILLSEEPLLIWYGFSADVTNSNA